MYLNNIDFPNQILDAIGKDKLVVFAGAGASMGKPTSLPNFAQLTEKIAEGTGLSIKNEPCEVLLGYIKAEGTDVNETAAHILSEDCLQHNALHEAIVDLFPSPDKVKIVTTNYDQMFEQVLEERKEHIPVYSSPALPLGNDVRGIIHVHGDVSDPKYMVVTDEDFGRAYLTDGYAARFLVRLFESYTVLFIGYSYNDTILRYLTRAMSREKSAERYILTSDTKSNWKTLGISAINYPNKKHDIMREGLTKLGKYAKKRLWDLKNQFTEIADMPPKDLTIETEIDYYLENTERSRVLADCIHGKEWLELLDKKNVFTYCFSDSKPVTENDKLWANWLTDKFVGRDDSSLLNLFVKHGNTISSYFSGTLLRKITNDENDLSDEFFKAYITLLDQFFSDQWIILRSIEISYKRHMYHLSLHLFEKLYGNSIKLGKNWFNKETLEPEHSLVGNYYYTNQAWELINKEIVVEYAPDILAFVQKTIEEVHYQYSEIGHASDYTEPFSMAMLVIEDRLNEYSKNPFHVLVRAYLQAIQALSEDDEAKFYLKKCLSSKSLLLRKIALKAIRESNWFSNDEKVDLLCDEALVWSKECKEQEFLLAQEVFTKASVEKQNQLLDIIEKGPADYEERHKQYAVYNWCIWLQRTNPLNERIESIIKQILRENDFAPREHPELNVEVGEVVWAADESPCSVQEMLEMSDKESNS